MGEVSSVIGTTATNAQIATRDLLRRLTTGRRP